MGYRIRILGKELTSVPLDVLQEAANPAVLEGDGDDDWHALILKHSSGVPIAFIEKNLVKDGELGGEELKQFSREMSYHKPDSAGSWLKEYFPRVKVIYSFQLLSGTELDRGFDLMHKVYRTLWRHAGGISQADQEGFSNERGHTILWQFGEHVTGLQKVGVLAKDGYWAHFVMDLGNEEHRHAFWRGEVPFGVELLPGDAGGA
jgi:hypothetical protein